MKQLGIMIVLLVVTLLSACRKQVGHGYTISLYQTDKEEAYQATASSFHLWLIGYGLRPASSPGGMAEWSGVHSAGDHKSWYLFPVRRGELLLRVSENEHGRHISASLYHHGTYTARELATTRGHAAELWQDILAWFDEHASNNQIDHTNAWLDEARINIQTTYSEK